MLWKGKDCPSFYKVLVSERVHIFRGWGLGGLLAFQSSTRELEGTRRSHLPPRSVPIMACESWQQWDTGTPEGQHQSVTQFWCFSGRVEDDARGPFQPMILWFYEEGSDTAALEKPSLDSFKPCLVSNLLFLGKAIERAAAVQLQDLLDDTPALDPSQSGFRPGHRTETALITLTDDLHRQLDQGGSALVLLLDLMAASDTVNHELLTHRLVDVGI